MKMFTKIGAGLAILSLAACGGGDDGGEEEIVSSGLLELILPGDAALASLPQSLQDDVADIIDANENGTIDVTPSGSSKFVGSFGIGFEDSDAIITGEAEVAIDIDGSAITYDFFPDAIANAEGDPTVNGKFGGNSSQVDGEYSGDLIGQIILDRDTLDEEIFEVDGTIDGVFTTDSETFGTLSGTITGDEGFDGLYFAVD